MKVQTILGLCLSGSLLLAGQSTLADNGKEKSNNRSERAVQVQIDKKTGKKIAQDDADAANAGKTKSVQPAAVPSSQTDLLLPAQSEAPVEHGDGTRSARVGQEHLKYLAVSIDENGNKVFTHQSSEKPEKTSETPAANEELE